MLQNDDLVRIDRASRTIISTTRQRDQTNQTCFNWAGDSLLTTTTDGFFKILDYPSLNELARFPAHNSSCNCVAYHPAGAYVATGASDGLVSLYRTDGWLPAKTFDAQAGPVKTVSFSCDGTYIAGGSDEGTGFEIGNVETGESVYKVETKVATPVVMWSPRDYAIAYAPNDWGLRVIGAPAPS
jgi:THO complex subunit 3